MPLCRNCRQSYTYRGDPEKADDSREWSDEDRLCSFCDKAEKRRKHQEKRPPRARFNPSGPRDPGLERRMKEPLI